MNKSSNTFCSYKTHFLEAQSKPFSSSYGSSGSDFSAGSSGGGGSGGSW
ncbi:MAG TPA: hypothetical protein V6D09_05860 [Leptolyngbyaceae cyanobacterium]